METQNLGKASESLEIPVSTASRQLQRLREAFSDRLFSKSSLGLSPTKRAKDLLPEVQKVLVDMSHLFEPEIFEPASMKRHFRIACLDQAAVMFIAPILPELQNQAPDVSIETTEIGDNWIKDLSTGWLDGVIGPLNRLPKEFHDYELARLELRIVSRPAHPLQLKYEKTGSVSLQDILSYPHIQLTYKPNWLFRQHQAQDLERGWDPHYAVKTPFFLAAALMLESTDLLLTLPAPIARKLQSFGKVAILPKIDKKPLTIHPRLIWHHRQNSDPGMQWLRSHIILKAKELSV